MELKYERDGQAYAHTAESLSPAAVAYLMQYGWAQSLQDSIAGLAKAKRADLEATDDFKSGVLTEADIVAEIAKATVVKLSERAKAIIEGTIGTREAVSRDPVSALAKEQVLAALKAKGIKLDLKSDTGKAKLAELVTGHVAKSGDKLRAEIERRKAAAADVVEIEV